MSDAAEWNSEWTHLLKAKASVDNLYRFRDHFFEEHEIAEAENKVKCVKEKLELLNLELDNIKDECERENRAQYMYLKGRALNVLPDYDKNCEVLLSRAIKLNPKLSIAWNELGECFWKKGSVTSAMDCFNGAIKQRRDKVFLRNLSMVLRQLPAKDNNEKIQNIEEGLRTAKMAVELDPSDGVSLTILGNAYMQAFFYLAQDPKTLKLSLTAYSQAESDVVAKSSPDLYYNQSVVWKYKEEYEKALEALEKARALDPLWKDLVEKQNELLSYLEKVQDLIQHKGRLKTKRLNQILKKLSVKDLGFYGESTSALKKTATKLKQVPLAELCAGKNDAIVLGKVVCTVYTEEIVPFVFCIVDDQMTCVCVSLYNLAEGKGMVIGDSVAIPHPQYANIKVKYKDKAFAFPSIRVESPVNMLVNGKLLTWDKVAYLTATSCQKAE